MERVEAQNGGGEHIADILVASHTFLHRRGSTSRFQDVYVMSVSICFSVSINVWMQSSLRSSFN